MLTYLEKPWSKYDVVETLLATVCRNLKRAFMLHFCQVLVNQQSCSDCNLVFGCD